MPQYTSDELVEIQAHYERFISKCSPCQDKREDVEKAYRFALKAHEGQWHRSGELYIHHLLSVAEIATTQIKLGPKSAIASLLHHIIEDTQFTEEDISKQFGSKITSIVIALDKIVNAKDWFHADESENFRRLLLSISDDIRVVLIRFADRIHVLRTIENDDADYRKKIAHESLHVYAPLAHRLGMYSIKKELEDLGFKNQRPHTYSVLRKAVKGNEEKRTKFINNFSIRIINQLIRENIEFKIVGRPKTIYSIWNKMKKKGVTFREVYDLSAIRIIFKPKAGIPELTQCWKIYEVIARTYTPLPDRLRDWVTVPKSTGYEALHTTISVSNRFVEVQIRSERMHEIAELGLAAHWKYKGVNSKKLKFDEQIREIQTFLKDPRVDKAELLDDFKLNLLSSDILVFTPDNEIKTLPKNSSVLDFAYSIHTKLAHKCIGAKINKQIYSISHKLKNGDKVEVLTSATQEPELEWHTKVVTAKAKTDLRKLFSKEFKQLENAGATVLDKVLGDLSVKVNSELFRKIKEHHPVKNLADLHLKIGKEQISEAELREILGVKTRFRHVRFWTVLLRLPDVISLEQSQKLGKLAEHEVEIICGASNPKRKFTISPCCAPRPLQAIQVYVDENQNCIVHKKECPHLPKQPNDELILHAEWRRQKVRAEMLRVYISAKEQYGLISQVTRIVDENYAVVIHAMNYKVENGMIRCYLDLLVPEVKLIHTLMAELNKKVPVELVQLVDTEQN